MVCTYYIQKLKRICDVLVIIHALFSLRKKPFVIAFIAKWFMVANWFFDWGTQNNQLFSFLIASIAWIHGSNWNCVLCIEDPVFRWFGTKNKSWLEFDQNKSVTTFFLLWHERKNVLTVIHLQGWEIARWLDKEDNATFDGGQMHSIGTDLSNLIGINPGFCVTIGPSKWTVQIYGFRQQTLLQFCLISDIAALSVWLVLLAHFVWSFCRTGSITLLNI